MRKQFHIRQRWVIFLLCASCSLFAQQWHTTIDILHLPQQELLSETADMLLVNNAVAQPAEYGHSVVLNGENEGNVLIDLSSAASDMLFAVAEVLDYESSLQSVSLQPVSESTATSFYMSSAPTLDDAQRWMQQYCAAQCLTLDRVIIYDKLNCFRTDDDEYYAGLEAYISTKWTAVNLAGERRTYFYADTLYWEATDYVLDNALEQLPDRQTALLDFARYAGERFARQFLPTYEAVDRYLYQPTDDSFDEAFTHFTHYRFREAVDAFGKAYEDADNHLSRAYALADMAVCYEILGDLKMARKYALLSQQEFMKLTSADAAQQAVNMAYYAGKLKQRIEEYAGK